MKYFLPAFLMCIVSLCTRAQDIVVNTAFGNNGVAIKSPEKKDNAFQEQATSVIELPNEKLLVAVDVNGFTLLSRHLPDGTQDKTYGKDGFSDPINTSQARAVLREDGKVFLIGSIASKAVFVIGLYDDNGKLDANFGNKGIKTISVQVTVAELKKVLLQSDGKIVLAGVMYSANGTKGFVLRLLADGTPDESFANAGLLTIDDSGITRVSDVVLSENKILVGASYNSGTEQDFAVFQYLENGTPDPDFGNNGQARVNVSAGDALEVMELQKDKKIVLSGTIGEAVYFRSGLAVARLLPDGKLDNTFNQTGIATVNFDSYNHLLRNVIVDENGGITIAGALQGPVIGLTFARFNSDGSLDMSFGDGGKKLIGFNNSAYLDINSGILTNSGALVYAGFYYSFANFYLAPFDYLLLRMNANGQPDEQFGAKGLVTNYFPGKSSSVSLPVQSSNGDLLLKYFAYGTEVKDGLVHLHPNGTPDQNFGEQGLLKKQLNVYGFLTYGYLPDGRIVTFEDGGIQLPATSGIYMNRFTKDGKPDLSFGNNGQKVIVSQPDGGTTFNGLFVQPDGRILITGTTYSSNHPQQGFLMRLDADGNADEQFGTGGKVFFDTNDRHEYPLEPMVQPDGKILVKGIFFVGYDGINDYSFIKRFEPGGKLDESFGNKGVVLTEKPGTINKLFLRSDDKLVATVVSKDSNRVTTNLLLRYNLDGTLDKEFGQKGSVQIPNATAFLLKNDNILLNNPDAITAGKNNAALMMFDGDGHLDKSFGINGTKFFLIGDSNNKMSDLSVQNDNVFITGYRYTGFEQEGLLASLKILYGPPSDTTISDFTLVNASTNKDIQELKDGDVLDLTKLPRASLNIRANTTPANVGSVVFELQGTRKYKHTEDGAPFALFSNNKGNYFGSPLPEGDYTLTATPYSKNSGKGTKGTPLTIHFKVVYPAAVTRFVLANAQTGSVIQEVKQGTIIKLANMPSAGISIRAITSLDTVGSVVFELQGQQNHLQIENLLPYALFGGDTKHDNPWIPQVGNYSLKATPYSGAKGYGTKGKEHSVQFKVVEMQNACETPSFAPVIPTRSGTGGYQTCSADFNNDGKPDMATLEYYAFNVGVLLGAGNGSFSETTPCPTGGRYPQAIATGDFNGDGNADLAIANEYDNDFVNYGLISILLGKGDGSFAKPNTVVTGLGNTTITVADFNKDGKPDLALTNNVQSAINILPGNGDGSFGKLVISPSGVYFPSSVAVGDFNGDGNKDLAIAFQNVISVLQGKGDGTFINPVMYSTGGSPLSRLSVADLNSDGKQDLVFTAYNSGQVGVLTGKGDGSFAEAVRYSIGGYGIISVAAYDFNGDDTPDLAVGNSQTQMVSIMLGKGDGSFEEPVDFPAGFRGSITLDDFNSDGKTDLAFSSQVYGVGVLLNTCNASTLLPLTRIEQKPSKVTTDKRAISLAASPNPFTSQSTIRFSVPTSGYAILSVYNATGAEVARLHQGGVEGGKEYIVSLDGKQLPAGIYLVRLSTEKQTTSLKVVLSR